MQTWTKLSDIPELKKVAQAIAEEESRASSLAETVGEVDQTFTSDIYKDDVMPAFPVMKNVSEEGNDDAVKEFINDDGVRHVWDSEMSEWVVAEDDDDDNKNGEHAESSKDEKAEETADFLKEVGVENLSNENDCNSKTEKRKRNKKKKKKQNDWNTSSNLWVYVDNLPLDVTVEEIKDHFSKAILLMLHSCCSIELKLTILYALFRLA